MALSEKYVTASAGGGGAGTSGDPWTLAEALTSAVAGDRVNIQSGAYSSGADSVSGAGSLTQLVIFRGYNSSIGDLDDQGRSTDGSLDTTNFPVITMTGLLAPSRHCVLQNLSFTGAITTTGIIYTTSVDNVTMISCKVVNTGNGYAIRLDNYAQLIQCDFDCTAATHSIVVDIDSRSTLVDCRIHGTVASGVLLALDDGFIDSCVFYANSTSIGIQHHAQFGSSRLIKNCTFYGLGTAITFPDSATHSTVPILINNHITDNTTYVNNLYSATSTWCLIEVNNRTRDNTTARTGIGDGVVCAEVTTDTGGASTDYEDATTGDFRLISAAPGIDAGIGLG